MNNSKAHRQSARIEFLKSTGIDFPFYAGHPVTVSAGQWLIVLAAVAVGFMCLTLKVPVLTGDLGIFIRALLFPVIPLVVLRVVAGPHWRALFRRLRRADFGWMLGVAALNLVISSLVGILVMKFLGAEANVAVEALAGQSSTEREWFFLRSIPQLFGEEVLTLLPMLAILYFCYQRLGLSRVKAVLIAWLLSSLMFGLVHLPSYNWNWLQCLLVIGTARLVLTLAYIKTKNILVSTGAHIINDWVIFGIVLLGAAEG